MKRSASSARRLLPLLIPVAFLVLISLTHQQIQDWIRLRNYTAPSAVAELATQDTMTSKARHLFYVNHPDITNGKAFTANCPTGGEKTVVLGCYVGDDGGIYLYDVTDPRLSGVEQVTAAHEMLHAAYRRLSSGERAKVDAMLVSYYENGLTDQRVKDTIADYKQSEPKDLVNEMHSVFGTEIASLPAPLEQYYKQYFTDRSKVTDYTAQYQAEFTSRQDQIASYDSQLAVLKVQIGSAEQQLTQQKAALDRQSASLQQLRGSNQIGAYNAAVPGYNGAVNAYNELLNTTRNSISTYNTIVSERNNIALEEQALTQALSVNALPDSQ